MNRLNTLGCLVLCSALLSAQPLENLHYPTWLSVTLIAKNIEVNGQRQTLYAYQSENTHGATHDYFGSLLSSVAKDESSLVNKADHNGIHTQAIFVAPYFITVAHGTEQVGQSGHISIIDLSKTNHSWDQLSADTIPQEGLQLIQRTTSSDTGYFDTWVFSATTSPASVSQSLKSQLLKSGWKPNKSSVQAISECQFFDWLKQNHSLWISICPSDDFGSAVIMVRAQT